MLRGTAALVLGVLVLCVGCGESAEVRQTPLEPLKDDPALGGVLGVPLGTRAQPEITLRVEGLEPGESYVLCLNAAEAGTRTSEVLGSLAAPGWPLGAFISELPESRPVVHERVTVDPLAPVQKGFWDFAKVQADERGVYERSFTLPLPALEYRVRFLLKDAPSRGSRSILQSETLLLSVDPYLHARYGLAGVACVAVLTGAGVALKRRRTPRGPASLPASNGSAHAPSPAPAPAAPAAVEAVSQPAPAAAAQADAVTEPAAVPRSNDDEVIQREDGALPVTAPPSLVDRARAEGVFIHHKDFAWVEIHGRRKSFRPRQALVFRILCEQDPCCYGIPQEQIVKEWEAVYKATRANPVRVLDIFRSRSDEPGDFIERVPGSASVYRLRLTPRDHVACDAEPEHRPRAASG